MYSSVVVSNLEKLSKKDIDAWNKISSSIFTRYYYIKAFEDEKIIDIVPRHILIYDDKKELIAFAISYIENQSIYCDFEESSYGIYSKFLNKFLSLKSSLVSFIPDDCGIKSIELKYENEKIYELILDKMSDIAKEDNIKQFVIYNVFEDDKILLNVLKRKKFTRVFSSFSTYIDIIWDSFDDYLKSLKRPKQKRMELRKNKEMNLKIQEIDVGDKDLSKIVDLINANNLKYQENFVSIPLSFYSKIHKLFPDKIKFFKFTLKGSLVGASMCVFDTNCLHSAKGGQIELGFKNYSFFESSIYDPVRIAIKNKLQKVLIGTHAYKYKIERGAKLRPVYVYVKSNNLIRNLILKYMFMAISIYKHKKHLNMIKSKS